MAENVIEYLEDTGNGQPPKTVVEHYHYADEPEGSGGIPWWVILIGAVIIGFLIYRWWKKNHPEDTETVEDENE